MQNLWLKRCSCGNTAVEFRSRKDLYNDTLRKLYCPACIKDAEVGTLMVNIRKWGSTTTKTSDIGVYGILYNSDLLKQRNRSYEWNEKEAIETFETGMVRPNLLSSVREDQDYHIYGLLKKGENPLDYKKRKVSEFRKGGENEVEQKTMSTTNEQSLEQEEKTELMDIADEVVTENNMGQEMDSNLSSSVNDTNDTTSKIAESNESQPEMNDMETSTDSDVLPDNMSEEAPMTEKQDDSAVKTAESISSSEDLADPTAINSNQNSSEVTDTNPAPVPLAGNTNESMTANVSQQSDSDNVEIYEPPAEPDPLGIENPEQNDEKKGLFTKFFGKKKSSSEKEIKMPETPF
ncbi:hypothetical protein KC660_01770 [Candidatus Dojkabacteria bacterium]|uniref:Uncharacterized protein n=1 Tax=Candidatus Dojkabacteria bacterium TaxID=2099670 RepID=A0A955L3C3_9BACT|nr:hypothetical protein [Candidatus Dojkabacteria bacterium]